MVHEKIKNKLKNNLLMISLIAVSTLIFDCNTAHAKKITQNINFSESMQQSASQTINISGIYNIGSAGVNTGSINYSMGNNTLTVNVTGGNPSRTVWNAYKYSKPVTDYSTSTSNYFNSTLGWGDGNGYSGTLNTSGSSYLSGSYTQPGATKTVTNSRSSTSNNLPSYVYYSDGYGYSGYLYGQGVTTSTVQTGGSPASSKYASQSITYNSTRTCRLVSIPDGWENLGTTLSPSWSGSSYYNDGTFSGTLTAVSGSGVYSAPFPSNGTTVGQVTTTSRSTTVPFAGYVSKPDTRTYSTTYSQNYSGTVSQSSTTVNTYRQNYSGTAYKGAYDNYYSYNATVTYDTDTTAPTLNFSKNPFAWTNGNVIITATGSDTESGVSKIQTPDGNWISGSMVNYTVSENGTYTFAVVDKLENQSTQSITVSNIDKIDPTLKLTPSTTNWINKNVISISASDSTDGSGIKNITLPDGTTVNSSTTTYDVTKNGTYQFTAIDNAGNKTIKDITISNIDVIPATVEVTQNPTDWTKENVSITLNATDDQSGVKSITFPDGTVVNNTKITYTVSSNGTYIFQVADNAGNVVNKTVTVGNIDNTPPVLTLTKPTTWSNTNTVITATAEDSISGVKQIVLPDGNIVNGSIANYAVDEPGVYYFTVVDNVGNTTTNYIIVDNIDNVRPTVEVTNNQDWTNVSSVPVKITGSDK